MMGYINNFIYYIMCAFGSIDFFSGRCYRMSMGMMTMSSIQRRAFYGNACVSVCGM